MEGDFIFLNFENCEYHKYLSHSFPAHFEADRKHTQHENVAQKFPIVQHLNYFLAVKGKTKLSQKKKKVTEGKFDNNWHFHIICKKKPENKKGLQILIDTVFQNANMNLKWSFPFDYISFSYSLLSIRVFKIGCLFYV